jgi:hypothetical protein
MPRVGGAREQAQAACVLLDVGELGGLAALGQTDPGSIYVVVGDLGKLFVAELIHPELEELQGGVAIFLLADETTATVSSIGMLSCPVSARSIGTVSIAVATH